MVNLGADSRFASVTLYWPGPGVLALSLSMSGRDLRVIPRVEERGLDMSYAPGPGEMAPGVANAAEVDGRACIVNWGARGRFVFVME